MRWDIRSIEPLKGYESSYRPKRVWDSRLSPTQPDLIDPVRCLTGLNTDRVIAAMLQFDANPTTLLIPL